MFRILIVCTANICRSPTAEVLLSEGLQGRSVAISSAGIAAVNGDGADLEMQSLLRERGLERITQHRSRSLLPSYVTQADLVLCMEPEHLDAVLRMHPLATGRTKLMGHWEGLVSVDDPTGGLPSDYEKALRDLERLSGQWADKVVALGMCQ